MLSIVGSCINRADLRYDGIHYLNHNKDLARHIVALLDRIKQKVQNLLHLNLNELEEEDDIDQFYFGEDLHNNITIKQEEEKVEEKNDDHNLQSAYSLLGNLSRSGYERMQKELRNQFNISKKDLPSYYKLTQNRPSIECFSIIQDQGGGGNASTHSSSPFETRSLDLDATSLAPPSLLPQIPPQPIVTASSFVGDTTINFSDAIEKIHASQRQLDQVDAAKIAGGYDDYMIIMAKKHQQKNRKLFGNVIVLDSYDGAEHKRTRKGKTGIVSFSSQMFSASTVEDGASPAKSLNILTWQQMVGDKKDTNVFPAVKKIYSVKERMREAGGVLPSYPLVKFHFYELHDGKMLYLLTQHSLFNRKHHPFLLCTCKRGEGVRNQEHQCRFLSQDEQIRYWERSLQRWEDKRKRCAHQSYQYFDHMDWIDEHNCGVSHFGIHPRQLLQDNICFDVFHLRCSITRRVMKHLRQFMLRQTTELMGQFSDLLRTFWSENNVLIWNLNKKFQSFNGLELLLFNKNSKKIVEFLKDSFHDTNVLRDLCNGILLWAEITPFLVLTTINNHDEYQILKQKFVENVKEFFDIGGRSFLTKVSVGNDETFYMHTLRFYLPRIADQTLNEFGLGLGVFTMQGFERRNKESKNTLLRFSNGKGNIVAPNLRRLYDVFYFESNNV